MPDVDHMFDILIVTLTKEEIPKVSLDWMDKRWHSILRGLRIILKKHSSTYKTFKE